MVGPGSRIGERVYEVRGDALPWPVPEWIIDALTAPAASPTQARSLPHPGSRGGTAYAMAALREETLRMSIAVDGTRHDTLNKAAFSLGQLVAAGLLPDLAVITSLADAARMSGLPDRDIARIIRAGLAAGARHPRFQGPGLPLPGREDDNRKCAHGALLESSPGRVIPGRLGPQALALAVSWLAGMHHDLVRPHLDLGVGEGPQVVDPSRGARVPAVAADDDEAPVVLHVGQPRSPPYPALGSHVMQQQHRRMTRNLMADPAPCRLVQGLVAPASGGSAPARSDPGAPSCAPRLAASVACLRTLQITEAGEISATLVTRRSGFAYA